MTVDELSRILADLPGHAPVNVAVIQPEGSELDAVPGAAAGVTYDLDKDGALRRLWLTATPSTDDLPDGADYRCACGELMRWTAGTLRDSVHDDCT